jgi:hypothetical protein
MARWCVELLGKEAIVGDGAIVMVLAETRLRFPLNAQELVADELHMATVLVGLTESQQERATLALLARTLTIGRSEARPVSEHDWVESVVQELLSRPEVECNLIFASRAFCQRFSDQVESLMSQIQAAGVNVGISTVVTELVDAPLSISGLHGLISAQADWLQTTITVFLMLGSLMAPVQYTCLDIVDLRPVFETGRVTRVIEVIASKSGDLLFASKDDEMALERAEKLVVFLWRNGPDSVAVGWSAVGQVRQRFDHKVGFVVSYADECINHTWHSKNMVRMAIVCRLKKTG